jgi:starch phosphorylase
MSHLQTFQVFPLLPEQLSFLQVLSRNLWWCWNINAIELFRRINPRLWNKAGRNPIVFLTLIPQERLEELSKDEGYLAHLSRVKEHFKSQVLSQTVDPKTSHEHKELIAYFSMEYGIHESLPLFAGGLGVLAGDHLKAASDMNIPLIAVGLLYHHGYFRQFLDQEGWQQEEYPETDLYHIPLERAKDPSGNSVTITIDGPNGNIHAIVWEIMVGRIPLFLLDTNIPENPLEIKDITSKLYAGDPSQRLGQEILLGIGGMRALESMGFHPSVCHMNEGHSAFSGLERLAQTMSKHHVDLKTAWEIVPRTTVFTTHTPVAAGHDEFPPDLVKPYLLSLESRLGVSADNILAWGQPLQDGAKGSLSMFVLGLRMAQHRNGVSALHGKVARNMWSHVWPGRPKDEVPIAHITNGIHIPSWISIENALLFERYLGPDWRLQNWNDDFARMRLR